MNSPAISFPYAWLNHRLFLVKSFTHPSLHWFYQNIGQKFYIKLSRYIVHLLTPILNLIYKHLFLFINTSTENRSQQLQHLILPLTFSYVLTRLPGLQPTISWTNSHNTLLYFFIKQNCPALHLALCCVLTTNTSVVFRQLLPCNSLPPL